MKIWQGKRVRKFEEAAVLAFEEAGTTDMSLEIIDLFASALDTNRLVKEADKSIRATVFNKYKKKTWSGEQWFVPVPRLGFKTKPAPQLIIAIQPYLVAPVRVPINDYSSYSLTLVGAVDKAVELAVPMIFLYAIINDALGRFRLVAKNSSRTTWEMPDTKEVRLPNAFISKLSETFERKSVTMWLESFGSQGRTVAPQVIGSLFGLQSMGTAQPRPTGEQAVDEEIVVNGLIETMGFHKKEAKEMFRRAAPNFWAGITLEEAFKLALQEGGKE